MEPPIKDVIITFIIESVDSISRDGLDCPYVIYHQIENISVCVQFHNIHILRTIILLAPNNDFPILI